MTTRTTAALKRDGNVSSRAFVRGLILISFLYAGIFSFIMFQSKNTMNALEEKFPYRVALIERVPPPPPPQEAYVYPPVPIIAASPVAQIPSDSIAMPEVTNVEQERHADVDVPMGPLKPAPQEGLYEASAQGKLPKIAPDGLTPFDAYKRSFSYRGTPVVAVAITDFGLSEKASDLAIGLPSDVTLILSPYAKDPELWQKKARETGHEVWLSLPMQNELFLANDPGAATLLVNSALTGNTDKIKKVMGLVTGYAGVISYTDKAFLDMHSMLSQIMEFIFSRGVAYAEANPAGSGLIETLAARKGAPYLVIDQSFDIVGENDIQRIESMARDNGFFVSTISLTPHNVEALKVWMLSFAGRDIALAPLSAIAAGRVPKKSAPRSTGADTSTVNSNDQH